MRGRGGDANDRRRCEPLKAARSRGGFLVSGSALELAPNGALAGDKERCRRPRRRGAAPGGFFNRAFVPLCPIGRFIGISTCFLARSATGWRRPRRRRRARLSAGAAAIDDQCGSGATSMAVARELEQRHQPPLLARVAVDIALRYLYRLVAGQQLHVAQAAAGLVRVSRRRRNEAAAP